MVRIPNLVMMNGVQIPQLGFGTYQLGDRAEELVSQALEVGYRQIDGAQMYGNEDAVGRAWVASGVPRDQLFLTSKLDNANHNPTPARDSLEKTLEELQTDYLDLFLVHWPLPMYYGGNLGATWALMEEFLEQGKVRSIGVSNFLPHHLQKVYESALVKPMVNQIESHPFYQNEELHRFDRNHGIITQAWGPLAKGRVVDSVELGDIGEKYGKSATQVAIRWGLQRGDVLFPKASTKQRMRENLEVFDFHLGFEEMERITKLEEGPAGRRGMDPDKMERLEPFIPYE